MIKIKRVSRLSPWKIVKARSTKIPFGLEATHITNVFSMDMVLIKKSIDGGELREDVSMKKYP
jgi:hypothetical protein